MSKILTPQQVFDRVVAHARTQGRAAMEGNYCRYRAYDGTKSFVGSLIADEHYTPAIELNLCSAPHVVRALQASGIQTGRRMHDNTEDTVLTMLKRLDNIHAAGWRDASCWEAEFKLAAAHFRLTYTPPTGLTTQY